MQRLLSTYLFVSRKLTAELLEQIDGAGFQGVEIFCTRSHFDYSMKTEIQAMASALEQHHLQLVSLHAPTSRDLSAMRESGTPLSICEVERVRRIEAMDELKRVIDVADDLPYARLILHMGGPRETADPPTPIISAPLSTKPVSPACASTLISATRTSPTSQKTNASKKAFRRCTILCLPSTSTITTA